MGDVKIVIKTNQFGNMVEAHNENENQAEEQPVASNMESNQEEEEEEEEEEFENNHDLIGVNGIIRAQKNEIDKKKVSIPQLLVTD